MNPGGKKPANDSLASAFGDRFTFIKRIGSGGASVVWEAEDRLSGQRIALKLIAGVTQDPLRHVSILKEAAIAQQLSHPHILKIHGILQDDHGHPCIAMELAEDGSLAEKAAFHGGLLSWQSLKPLALQLCDALSHAHARGVVHRDIKPANLLLAHDKSLRLADFGCATVTEVSHLKNSATVTIISQGTLAYMGPQQLNGEKATSADDIYAVGATLHALLVGHPPFHTGYLAHQILTTKPPGIRTHQKQLGIRNPVPQGVAQVIAACLAKQPSARPSSALELRRLLENEAHPSLIRRRVMFTLLAGAGLAAAGIPLWMRGHRQGAWDAETPHPDPEPGPPASRPPTVSLLEADGEVLACARLPDGGMLLGGRFSRAMNTPRAGLARLLADGRLDESFEVEIRGLIRCLLVLEDGRILCGGDMENPSTGARRHLVLLERDGSLSEAVPDCDRTVLCLCHDETGRVLAGGTFTRMGEAVRGRIARLNADLELDASFHPDADGNVHSIVPLDDGRMFIGGQFSHIASVSSRFLARLNPDGNPDSGFAAGLNAEVTCLALQADGALLVGGRFSSFRSSRCGYLIRLMADGTWDRSFMPAISSPVLSMLPREDGCVHVSFGGAGGGLFLLARDGKILESRSADKPVTALAGLAGGGFLAGGPFSKVDGQPARCLFSDGKPSPAESLRISQDGRIFWPRAAADEALRQVRFEYSTDKGLTWNSCGQPLRVPGGWQVKPEAVPGTCIIRAVGISTGGIHNGSHGLVVQTLER